MSPGVPQVAIVSRSGCKYCLKAKDLLNTENIPFSEVDVTDNLPFLNLIREATGQRTVPQIFINGDFVGGADNLDQLFEQGSLKTMLESANKPGLPADLAQQIDAFLAQQADKSERVESSSVAQVPQELLLLADKLKSVFRNEKSTRSFTYRRAFSGADAVRWLQTKADGSRERAAELGAQLLTHGLIYPIVEDCHTLFRAGPKAPRAARSCLQDAAFYCVKGTPVEPRHRGVALNGHYVWTGEARPAIQVSSRLRLLIARLYDEFLSKDGKGVSYRGIAASPLFHEYVDAAAELQRVDLQPLSREELLCFFINLYNALIIHATVAVGVPANFLQRGAFFSKNAVYNVAGQDYTADDMEHGVLRGNAVAPGSLGGLLGIPALQTTQFKAADPRAAKVVRPVDPRIHFALVCGAKSCPPIRLYEPDSLEEGLQGAAEAFCSSELKPDFPTRTVTASMILKWYGGDFGSTTTQRLRALLPYLADGPRSQLEQLLALPNAEEAIKWKFEPYDWAVNTSDKQ